MFHAIYRALSLHSEDQGAIPDAAKQGGFEEILGVTDVGQCCVVLCRLSPAIENLSPWLKIGDNRLKIFTIDCRNSVMVPSVSVTFGSVAVG